METILITDDEKDIRKLLSIYLKKQNYNVVEAENGNAAIKIMSENTNIDLIIMDIMMSGMSGMDACRKIREFSSVPILFLTAKTQEQDKNEAYDMGGDDFLCKPFTQNELVRKVKSLIRRYNVYKGKEENNSAMLTVGDMTIDIENKMAIKNDRKIHLTEKEFALLCFLVRNRGKAWTLTEIYENVWHEKYLTSSSNTVMVHILRLRQKIEDNPAHPDIIKTVYGKGYEVF